MNIHSILLKKVKQALLLSGVKENCELQICQSSKIKFGDYQVNSVMTIAKKLGIPSRKLAEQIIAHLDLIGIADKIEIAGPGFINIFLSRSFLSLNIDNVLKSKRLGISLLKPKTIVVDYSSPNVAKEMHVGHLRSTIIGDATVRTLEFLGHKVIRANHIGDWGTQFGILIAWLENQKKNNIEEITLENIEKLYCQANKYFYKDKIFAERAREYVVKLQNGDNYFLQLWKKLVNATISKNQIIYEVLNVTLTNNDIMGESLYNAMLPEIIADLKEKGIAVESKGATVVFLNEFKNKEGKPMGVIIQKKDGGYLYTTTDIACLKYRSQVLHADRIIYYTDSRQHQHLMQVWTIARKAGYISDHVQLEHHMFGMVLGKNRKPLKTRDGSNMKLSDLLNEALARARQLIFKKKSNKSIKELERLINVIGIGALKYADLSKNRVTDYVFDLDSMLSFEGNTAPYIQYAYIRAISIIRKTDINECIFTNTQTIIANDHEMQLATHLLQFEEIINQVAYNGTPHIMCSYLYNLAELFSKFYENFPILLAKDESIRNTHLKLTLLTAKTLKLGLNILGIETVEEM